MHQIKLTKQQKENFATQFKGESSIIRYMLTTTIPELIIICGLVDMLSNGIKGCMRGEYYFLILDIVIIIFGCYLFYVLVRKYPSFNNVHKSAFEKDELIGVIVPSKDVRIERQSSKGEEDVFSQYEGSIRAYYTLEDKEYEADNLTEDTKKYLSMSEDSLLIITCGYTQWEVALSLIDYDLAKSYATQEEGNEYAV